MKKLVFSLVIVFLFFSCKKVEELFTFTINDTSEITIEKNTPLSLPFEIWVPPVTTNSTEEFENNNTAARLVKNIYITKLELEIISPQGKTFGFLKSMTIYISTDDSNEIELARKENINSDDVMLKMNVSSERMDEYVKSDHYRVRTEVTLRETQTQDVDIRMNMSFRVTASPL